MSSSSSSMKQEVLLRTRLQELQDKEKSLQATIDKVLHLPERVSYDVMVPISNVAFYPAKLIHTNEFKVLHEGETEADLPTLDFISHVQAAEVLRLQLQSVEKEVSAVEEKLHENNGYTNSKVKSALKKSTPSAASNASTASTIAKSSPVVAASEPTASSTTSKPVVQKKEDTIAKALEKVKKEEKELQTVAPAPTSSGPVFEIREFLDAQGNTQTEVLDISKQLQYMEQLSQQTGDDASNIPMDEETKFVQELSQIHTQLDASKKEQGKSANHVDDEDFDAMMEMLMQLGEKETKMNNIANTAKKPAAAAASSSGGGGWKAGFLSGGSSNAKPTAKKEKESPAAKDDSKAMESKKGVSFAAANEVRTIDDNSTKSHASEHISNPMPPPPPQSAPVQRPVSNNIAERTPQAPKPFGNTIMEKSLPVAPKPLGSAPAAATATPAASKPMSNVIVEKEVSAPRPYGNTIVEKAPSGPKPLPKPMARR